MGSKLLIVQVAALSHDFHIEGLTSHRIESVFPAVTCSVQASFRTASSPARHGMVGNGLFFRSLCRPLFWEQSSRLVQGERIWEHFRSMGKRVAMLFWQQSLGECVDIVLSPAPIHKHHGGMIQGCYCRPPDLYDRLCKKIGRPFALRQYWGPLATWKVGEWIESATSALLEDSDLAPDLCFTYLPTLDYDLQRNDPIRSKASILVREKCDGQLSRIVKAAQNLGYEVLVYGDYHIAPVHGAVLPNLALCNEGIMRTRSVKEMLYPDFYGSKAFAVVDHEIAHVYISEPTDIPGIKHFLSGLPGVEKVLDRDAQTDMGLNHENSGDLVLVSADGNWFAYPWWSDKKHAPDFAGHVDIHNKPGYDPCELFFGWPPGSVSQDTGRIRGSHGRVGWGRETTWAATLSIPDKPANLIELASAVRQWLNERG